MTYQYTFYRLPLPQDGAYVRQYGWVWQALQGLGWSVQGLDPNLYSLTAERNGLALVQQSHTNLGNVWELSVISHSSSGHVVYLMHQSSVLNDKREQKVCLVGFPDAVEAAIKDLGLEA